MRTLFVSAPLAAHLDWGGLLATATALHERGHEVAWASGAAVAPNLSAAGVPFAVLSETGFRWPPPAPLRPTDAASPAEYERLRRERSLDQWLDVERVLQAVEDLGIVIARFAPDLIVSECFAAAAGVCAEQAAVPFAVGGWPAHASGSTPPEMEWARERLSVLLDRCRVSGVNFAATGAPALRSPLLHVSYWSESWFEGVSLLPQTRHVGGIARAASRPDPSLPDPEDRPWVLITLGTNFNRDLAFFRIAAQAASEMGCLPLVVTGTLTVGERIVLADRLPEAAVVRESVDFAAVLPWTSSAIHHGGAGTTHALVTHAIPQIVVPHAGDQARQALGVQRSGTGVTMPPREATVERLRAALAAILPDLAPARTNAQNLRAEFAALGGIPQAASLLEQAAAGHLLDQRQARR